MLQDFRFALRQLRRTPVFACVTILTLALGIGANTAVFSVMNAVVLRWLPVAHPEQLVFLHTTGQPSNSSQTGYDDTSLTLPIYEQLRTESRIFSDLIAFVPLDTNRTAIRHGSEPETAWADMVSGNFFSGLGVRMARGRALTMDDERRHTQDAVLSSDSGRGDSAATRRSSATRCSSKACPSRSSASRVRIFRASSTRTRPTCGFLLVGAGLLVRTLQNLNSADLGFRASGLLVFGVTPPQTVRGDEAVARFYQLLMARLRTLPGVEAATVMSNRIGSGWSNNTAAVVDGQPPDAQKFSPMRWNAVGPDYFHVLGTPLLLGRDFTESDGSSAPPVVIVNETFVQRYLPNRQPLGHRVSLSKPYTIVGVAANSRYTGVRESDRPMAYFPSTQVPSIGGLHVELRTNGDPAAWLPQVRRVVQEFGPDIPLLQPMTQKDQSIRHLPRLGGGVSK